MSGAVPKAPDVSPAAALQVTMLREDDTLQRVADAVVNGLGFGVAVVNLVIDADTVEVVAVAGSAEAREVLLGTHNSITSWEARLAGSESWGMLRFDDHRSASPDPPEMVSWVPDLPVPSPRDSLDGWHPDDALYAPLFDPDQTLLGVLSVDLPPGARRPDRSLCRSLEALAITAALAIGHARLHQRARASEQLLRTLLDSSPLGLALLDRDRHAVTVNPAFARLVGDHAEHVIAMAFTPAVADQPAAPDAGEGEAHEDRTDHELRLQVEGAGETSRWLRVRVVELVEETHEATHLLEVEDVTERRQTDRRLRYQAQHDPLTGLPNRAALLGRLERALGDHAVDGALFATLYCDLDAFKSVNDSFGHPVGDTYLQAVAARLQSRLRDGDVLGRFGGDEFVVVTGPLESAAAAAALADRLVGAVAETLQVHGESFLPSISVGVALVSGAQESADRMLQRADLALYEAKRTGGGTWRFHAPG